MADDAAQWPWRYTAAPESDRYDEVFDGSGNLRPDWKLVAGKLQAMGVDELRHRWDQAKRLLHEHGVSYDVYGDREGSARPWNLSPIPVVFAKATWEPLARGLAQRARLLDGILADIYGSQKLLAEGLLPPEIVFGHPGFLRPCAGISPAAGQFLPLFSADVVRGKDGRLAVLSHRTQAPTGVGYALENRIVLSRSLAEVYRDCHVERLASFFQAMRELLLSLAPSGRESPLIVLLTPGPYTATYFEQAFLAQYLALTLVRGEDLVVREARVYLKTLGGLKRVDVIVRRVNDDFCDPLELRRDSFLGVPGLVEAVRAGEVALVNPLGSGIAQSSAILPFLPAISRRLLGEDLELPSIPTYWCGDPQALAYVEEHLAELVYRPTFSAGPTEPIFGCELGREALDELRAKIHAHPRRYVAQESVRLSTVASLSGAALSPVHLWMRTYAVRSGSGYEVMPGALSRTGGEGQSLALSLRPGGESKDTWVLADGPVAALTLLPPASAPVELSRDESDLPSRVADNLFWLGRYAERSEGTARVIRAIATRLSDHNGSGDLEPLPDGDALLRMLEGQTYLRPRDAGTALLEAVFDAQPSGTLRATLAEMHRVARTLRDWIPVDAWRTIAHLDQEVRRAQAGSDPNALRELVDLLNRLVSLLSALQGFIVESMTHDQGWRFLDIGRRLERAAHVVRLLRSALVVPCTREGAVLEALLEITAGSATYRRRYLATLQAPPVVDLLLCDETNPRSALFQLETIGKHLAFLPRGNPHAPRALEKLVLAATTDLRLTEVVDVCDVVEERQRPRLQALLDRVGAHLPTLSNSLSAAYFNHAAFSA